MPAMCVDNRIANSIIGNRKDADIEKLTCLFDRPNDCFGAGVLWAEIGIGSMIRFGSGVGLHRIQEFHHIFQPINNLTITLIVHSLSSDFESAVSTESHFITIERFAFQDFL